MNRRDLLSASAAAALTQAFATACVSAQPGATPAAPPKPKHTVGGAIAAPTNTDAEYAALADAAADCVTAGETCLTHCIEMLAKGHKGMAACAEAVDAMLAVCRATQALAAKQSAHARAMARLCSDVCSACAEACKAHAKMHATCAACETACNKTVVATQPFLG